MGANVIPDLGEKGNSAITDPAVAASVISLIKGILTQIQGGTGAAGNTPVSLATALSSIYDTIDVSRMGKGSVTIAHNAITVTATSAEIDCRGNNGVDIDFTITAGSGKWNIEVQGCSVSGGTFKSIYLGRSSTSLKRQGLTANANFSFPITSNYIKIVATEITDGATVTINVTPCVIATVPETDPRQCRWETAVILAATNEYGGAVADLLNDSAYDYTGNVDLESLGSKGLAVTLEYDCVGITNDLIFSVFGSLDGVVYDDIELYSITCGVNGGVDTQISLIFPSCSPHLRFGVKSGATDTYDYRITYRAFK